ncbi:Uncharacterized protein PCOAH_00045090 [Plasmodium coatneyi]|uniref:Uncharacterized protein n=1 Tax=Plasmodium coatneyi TaxID=208452 RepID=A0A1B1E3P4_9APIC|nr:Uncharacterized protein PCOAH_00045090 [Plasmodium coatneyi]ANQ09622.1 Uncharacterized protein PCOAH_00045090 [Plasmodium coatneyi]
MMEQIQSDELLNPRKERKIIRNIKSMSRTNSINYEGVNGEMKINLNSKVKMVKSCARKNYTHGGKVPTLNYATPTEEKNRQTSNDGRSKQSKGKTLLGKIKTCRAKRIKQRNQPNVKQSNEMNPPCVDAEERNSYVKGVDTNHGSLKNVRQLRVDLQFFLRNAQYLNEAFFKRDTLQSNRTKKEILKMGEQNVVTTEEDRPDCAGNSAKELVTNEQSAGKGEIGTKETQSSTHQQCSQSFTQTHEGTAEMAGKNPQNESSLSCYQIRHTTMKEATTDPPNKQNSLLMGEQKRSERKCRQRGKTRNRHTPSSDNDDNNIADVQHVRKRMKWDVYSERPLRINGEQMCKESTDSVNKGPLNSNTGSTGNQGIPENVPYDHVEDIIDRVNLNGTQLHTDQSSTNKGEPPKRKNCSIPTERAYNIKDIIDRNVLTNFIKCVNKQYMNGNRNEPNQTAVKDRNGKNDKGKLLPVCTPGCSTRGVTYGSKEVDHRGEDKNSEDKTDGHNFHVVQSVQSVRDGQCDEKKQQQGGNSNVHINPYDRPYSGEMEKLKKSPKSKDPSCNGENVFANCPTTCASAEKEISHMVNKNAQVKNKLIQLNSLKNEPPSHFRRGYNDDLVTHEKGNPSKEATVKTKEANKNDHMATEKLTPNLAFNKMYEDESSALIRKYQEILLQNVSKSPPHVDKKEFEKCKYCVLHILNQHRGEDGDSQNGNQNGNQSDNLLCKDGKCVDDGLKNEAKATAHTGATKAGIYQDIAHIGDLTKSFKGNYESLKNYLNNLNKKEKNVHDYLLNLYCYAYIRQCAVNKAKTADGNNPTVSKEEENKGKTIEGTLPNNMNNHYGKDKGDSVNSHSVKGINENANSEEKGKNSPPNLSNEGVKLSNSAPSNSRGYNGGKDFSANCNQRQVCSSVTKEDRKADQSTDQPTDQPADHKAEHVTGSNPLRVNEKPSVDAKNGEIRKILCRYYNYLKLKNYIIPYNMYNNSTGVTNKESSLSQGGAKDKHNNNNDESNDKSRHNNRNATIEEDLINISYNFITEHRGPNNNLTYDHFCNFHKKEFFKKRTNNMLNRTDEAATKKWDEPKLQYSDYNTRLMSSYTYDGHHSKNAYKKKNNGSHFYLFKYLIENLNREELQKLMLCQCCYVIKKIENKMTPLDVILDTQILFHDCNRYFKNQGWVDNNGISQEGAKLETHNLGKDSRSASRSNPGEGLHFNALHRNELAKLHNGVGTNGGKPPQNRRAAPTCSNPSEVSHHANSSSDQTNKGHTTSSRSSVHFYNFENHEVSMTSTTASMSWQGKAFANEKNKNEEKCNEKWKRKNDKGRNNHLAGKAEKENKEKVKRYQKARSNIDCSKFESALFRIASRKLRDLHSQGENIYTRGKRMPDTA